MLKNNIDFVNVNGLNYICKNGIKVEYTSWLGDIFAGSYDRIMKSRVFPKLFGSDSFQHRTILKDLYKEIDCLNVLELGTGSGNAAEIINSSNSYTGVDISSRLLRRAKANFEKEGYKDPQFFVCSADSMPFEENLFDVCICNLSLNFFPDTDRVISQIKSVLKANGKFICSVPLADRVCSGRKIRGEQFTLQSLKRLMHEHGLSFCTANENNGALIYFISRHEK